jgi:hypothetical protein
LMGIESGFDGFYFHVGVE